ncbi:MAG: nuclear transport factor 2 family protein [Nitriliruptorales bacterium]
MTRTSSFDLEALRRGHEQHDAATLSSLYTDDAVLEIVDATSPPSDPRRLEGVDAIRGYYDDVCGRDMTHRVEDAFTDGDRLAFRVACRYDTGERVLTSETCQLRNGQIARETLVQAWDG